MYKNKRNTNKNDVISYIDGNDIYNSELIKKYIDSNITKETYLTNKSDKRSDLLSTKLYGDYKMESFIYLLNPNYSNYTSVIKYSENFDNLLMELNV